MMYINWSVDTICPMDIFAGYFKNRIAPREYPLLRKVVVNCAEFKPTPNWAGWFLHEATDIMVSRDSHNTLVWITNPQSPEHASTFRFLIPETSFTNETTLGSEHIQMK
jgi:hypothetical protein